MAPADDDLDEKARSESEPDEPDSAKVEKRPRAQREVTSNRQIDPLKLRFSQMRARHEFRDGKLLEDSVADVKAVRCEECQGGATWKLEAPFPPIEVLQWRCKLRDESTGRPKMDPISGEEMWDSNDRWFTLDNRRLWCLQKAAVALWPERAVVDVVELPAGPITRIRELKKFRTLDCGRSVFIGGRKEGETLVRWSWREAADLPVSPEGQDSDDPEEGDEPTPPRPPPGADSDRVHLRQRKRYTSGGKGWDGRAGGRNAQGGRNGWQSGWSRHSGGHSTAEDESESYAHSRFGQMSWGSLVVFLGIYVVLRFSTKLMTALTGGKKAVVEAQAATDSPVFSALVTGGTAALLATGVVHLIKQRWQG
jgi:hypothetical protein